MEQSQVFTRTMYCPECAKAGRPERGQVYVVIGSTNHALYYKRSGEVPRKLHGYTPHLIYFEKVCLDAPNVGYIQAVVACAVNGCGVRLQMISADEFDVIIMKAREMFFEPMQWAALKKWKDTGYELS